MRRLLFIAIGAFFLAVTLLPMQPRFVVHAVSDGERLSMYSKPAVVRIIDGVAGQILFQPPGYQGQTFNVSAVALGSGFFISSNGYIATNAHVVSITKEGEEKAKRGSRLEDDFEDEIPLLTNRNVRLDTREPGIGSHTPL